MIKKYLLLLIIYLLAYGVVFSDEGKQEKYSKNTITIDTFYFIPTLSVWSVTDFENTFVITALQYERQINKTFSISGRFGYRSLYFDDLTISTISAESHFRFYPEENVFFLNGVIGYTYLDFERKNENVLNHYAILGCKVGWRINFDKSRGFIIEPSLGYYMPFGKAGFQDEDDNFLIKSYLIGGFQFSFAIGVRF